MENNYEKFLSDITLIKRASETKKLVIFVGAGVSINSGLPSWYSLIKVLKEDIGINKEDTEDPLQVAQVYFNQRKNKEYVEKIREALHYKKGKYNSLHEVLFDLKPEHIVTTNYDDFLEQVIKKRALSFSVIKSDKDFPYAANTNLLVKIHGDLDNDDFILKEDDYLNYEADHPLFEAFIKAIFSTKLVLFVGYSYSDVNLKIILQKVRNILGKDYQSSYLLTHENVSAYKRDYLRNKGVNVVSYLENKNFINGYLNGDNSKHIMFRIYNEKLSSYGQDLLDLLVFINVYDRYKERLSKNNIIEQMYLSLSRYSELKSLPYYFISNLYPFNDKAGKVYNNEQSEEVLAVRNLNLLNYLHENTVYESGNTKFTPIFLQSIKEDEVSYYNSKLSKIIEVLNLSGIYYLNSPYGSPTGESFLHESIIFHKQYSSNCECLMCLFDDLKLDKLVSVIAKTNITETSDVNDDMLLAFVHYRLGNIYQACNLFEEVAQKSWHAGKYISYFISKFNYKKLSSFIDFAEYKIIDDEEIKKLKVRADNIDLEDIYRQINDVSKEESELIRIIRDNDVLNYINKQIQEKYNQSISTYSDLKKGATYYIGPNYSRSTRFYIDVIDNFYNVNYIVRDGFADYKSTINVALKTFLIGYKFDEAYPSREDELGEGFWRNFLNHAKADEYIKFFNEYHIDRIKIKSSSKISFLVVVNNYLRSFYRGKDFRGKIKSNKEVNDQSEKGFLNDKFASIFSNAFFLLSKIDLDKESVDELSENLLNSMQVIDFLYWKNTEYIALFLDSHCKLLDSKFYNDLLKVLVNKPKLLTKELLLHVGSSLKNSASEDRINNIGLIDNIRFRFNNFDQGTLYHNKLNIVYLWMFIGDNYRQIIESDIEKELSNDFDSNLYSKACFMKIIDYNISFEKYIFDVNLQKSDSIEEISEEYFKLKNVIFINFISLYYFLEVSFDDYRLNLFSNLDDYMIFYLNPSTFDYSKFRPGWLKLSGSPQVHKKLSEYIQIKESLKAYIKLHADDKDLVALYLNYYL